MNILDLVLAVVGLLGVAVLAVLWLVVKTAASQEAASVVPGVTKRVLTQAKSQLPSDAQPRWEEEWPAGFEVAIEKRPLWALREALSLYVGARRIARELEPATAPAGVSGRLGEIKTSAAARFGWLLDRFSRWLDFYRRVLEEVTEEFDRRLPSPLNRRILLLMASVETYILIHGFHLPW